MHRGVHPSGVLTPEPPRAYEGRGETDAAWQILRVAIPLWEPLGPHHIAPVGLLVDPVLAPVLTAARCLGLLATPRGGERGPAPAPACDQAPDGLSWLARPGGLRPGQSEPPDYRMVLVEGVAPDELPALLGSSPDTALSPPLPRWDVSRHHRPDQRVFSSYDDKALLRVGRAGAGWSFGFDENPSTAFSTERFVSPAQAASAGGGRAIVVWSEGHRHIPVFHVSVAQDGTLLYAFTVRDGAIEDSSGAVPRELAPAFLGFDTPGTTAQAAAVARALDALADRYGVTLPHLALAEGRLHSLRFGVLDTPARPRGELRDDRLGPQRVGARGSGRGKARRRVVPVGRISRRKRRIQRGPSGLRVR